MVQGVVLFGQVKVQKQISVCAMSWWNWTILFSRSVTPPFSTSQEWLLEINIKTSSCHILPVVSHFRKRNNFVVIL